MDQARLCFNTWLKDGDGIFHISGKPGAGKSTLMKYLCRNPKTQQQLESWAGQKTLVFSKFFFWKPGTELQKSLAGLIRGLLHCLLSNSPSLIPVALPAQWAASLVQEYIYLDGDQIRGAFDTVISSSESCHGHKFVFFIDGLDEFTGNHAELIRQLFDWTGKTKDVKICVSSREWAIFQDRFRDCPKIKLHELTRSDIRRVVRDRLCEPEFAAMLQEARCIAKDLEESIVEKSDGVFLWVSIMLRLIEEGLINGDQMRDLQHKIDFLPTELENMFLHLFDSISRPNQQIAYLILDVALLVSETEGKHCCLSRYSFLEDYVTDANFAMAMPVEPADRPFIMERLNRARRRIYGVCKGFLELVPYSAHDETVLPKFAEKLGPIKGAVEAEREAKNLFGGAVKFTHRSIVEFLSGQSIRQRMQAVLLEIDTFDAWCQTLLAQVKTISMHQPELCYPDPVPSSGTYTDYRKRVSLLRYYGARPSRRNKLLPAWFGDDLIDIAHIAATRARSQSSRFEHFISCISCSAAELGLSRIHVEFIDSEPEHFWCNREVSVNLSAVPYYAVIIAGPPLPRTALAALGQHLKLWMLLGTMEEIAYFCSHRSAFIALQNLRLYLEEYNAPNEVSSAVDGVPRWHFYLWKCCWNVPVLATIALFLYYGANPWFWLVASPWPEEERNTWREKATGPTFKFWFETGSSISSSQDFDRWNAYDNWKRDGSTVSKEYEEFWERHNYRLSFRDLLALWFPKYARGLQEVVDWLGEQDMEEELSTEKRQELQDTFGPFLRPLFEGDVLEGFCDKSGTRSGDSAVLQSFGSMVPGTATYQGRFCSEITRDSKREHPSSVITITYRGDPGAAI
jgi:NACHT domain